MNWNSVSPVDGSNNPSAWTKGVNFQSEGAGKNYGNFPGLPSSGWRSGTALLINIDSRTSGILEGIKIGGVIPGGPMKSATGDWSGLRIGDGTGQVAGGCVDASCEAVTPIIVDGTQIVSFFCRSRFCGDIG